MKILYYNWIPFDNAKGTGGGVNVYQKNLIEAFLQYPDYEIFFLSSGREYRFPLTEPYIKSTANSYGTSCHTYTIINSPILAPGNYLNCDDLETYLKEEKMHELIKQLIIDIGGVDVIHFNNWEGLSLSVMKLKKDFPRTRIIYSLHNYYPFCTQVNLWNHDTINCNEYCDGAACINCHDMDAASGRIKEKLALTYLYQSGKISHEDYQKCNAEVDQKYRTIKNKNSENPEIYKQFRERNISCLNKYADCILAVSNRVKEIAVSLGISAQKISTLYIGTTFAEKQLGHLHKFPDDFFTFAYLGYMRREKGFYFFLEACEKMDFALAAKCNVIFAAKVTDSDVQDRIERLSEKFHKVYLYNGYTHDNMNDILKNVHLGIVPVLWEDNLPQIAIEFVSMGIPILTSHLGGAKELSSAEEFCFCAGDHDDFIKKIKAMVDDPLLLHQYFEQGKKLTTMDEHIKDLIKIYQKPEGELHYENCSNLK